MKTLNRGVTLVELMVVLLIAAVLASIAVPSYRQYVLRSNRTEAAAALLNVAAAQEKFYLQNNTYADDTQLATAPPAGLGLSATTERGYYTIAINAAGAAGFTATATAVGSQAADSDCASFTINQAGTKTATSTGCWR
jgi:type IV pilus assembly protein PilE